MKKTKVIDTEYSVILKDVDKVYDNGFQAVTKFNLTIKPKEFIVFVGPSGCGKSTTLRMIAGLEEITRGELYLGGVLSNEIAPSDRGISMVFQSYALYPHLSVYENLAFGLTLAGYDEFEIKERVDFTSKILSLDNLLDRKPRNLSGGQRQRVALGRAVIRHSNVYLMDEPLSNLDAKLRVTMRSELIKIHRAVGATTIYVTHDQVEAMTMADRIVVMSAGFIQQIGTPKELYFNPINLFVAGFIGEPPMNLVKAVLEDDKAVASDISVDLKKALTKKELQERNHETIHIGLRPEYLTLKPSSEDAIELCGVIELLEMLGDTLNIYLNFEAGNIIVKADPSLQLTIGEKLKVYIDPAKLHLFDKDGIRINGPIKDE